ncbi:hypothetical protein [Glutamicibacter uratoxydans]|uniref:hypothetical protein n=1 Tax=Glutamicibacter uratoxydans TaxID=43667 RepID=UPI003D6F0F3A
MKKLSGSVLLMLFFVVVAVAGAAALAIGGINVVQRAVGAHTQEARVAAEERSPEPKTAAQGTESLPTERASGAQGSEWANDQVNAWLQAHGAADVAELAEPYRQVQAWYSSAPGELALLADSATLSDVEELEQIAEDVLQRLAAKPQLQSVSVSTSDGKLTAEAHR